MTFEELVDLLKIIYTFLFWLTTTEAQASRAHAIFLLDMDLLVDSSFLVTLQIYGSLSF